MFKVDSDTFLKLHHKILLILLKRLLRFYCSFFFFSKDLTISTLIFFRLLCIRRSLHPVHMYVVYWCLAKAKHAKFVLRKAPRAAWLAGARPPGGLWTLPAGKIV